MGTRSVPRWVRARVSTREWAVSVAGLRGPCLAPPSQADRAHSWENKPRRAHPVFPRADPEIRPREWASWPWGPGSKRAIGPSRVFQRVRPGARLEERATGPEGRALENWPRGLNPRFLRRPGGESGPRVSGADSGSRARAPGAGSEERVTGPGAGGGDFSGSGSDSLSLRRPLASFGK